MPGEIITEVSATMPAERGEDVAAAFAELAQRPLPDGLLRTELLAGRDGEWRIQSLWRDQAALDAMRAGNEPPAAPALFRRLGAEPVLRIYDIQARHAAQSSASALSDGEDHPGHAVGREAWSASLRCGRGADMAMTERAAGRAVAIRRPGS